MTSSYNVCGLSMVSNIPFPELASTNGRHPECSFQLLSGQEPQPASWNWFHHWYFPEGTRWLSCARGDGCYLLRFHDLANFLVSRNGEEILCYPEPHTPPETVRHLLLDQVIPLVLNLRGKEALHASAVITPHGACAFMGEAGWGKSTLAGSFLSSGCSALSDDCLALETDEERVLGVPSYPGLRLPRDAATTLCGDTRSSLAVAHYTEKRRVGSGAPGPDAPVPLKGLYVLHPPSGQEEEAGIKIDPLPPRESFMELVRYTFRLDITDRAMLARQFLFCARVISRIPVRRLTYPRDFSLLPAVQEAILWDLEARARGEP